jgi:predicted ATPase
MITELSCSNFKSWLDIKTLRLAPITGLFGTNSSGKTSILQLLLLLKQTVESTDRLQTIEFGNEKTPANLGAFKDLIHNHEEDRKLSCTIKWKLDQILEIEDPSTKGKTLFKGDIVVFSTTIYEDSKKRISVDELSYKFAEHTFLMRRKITGKYALSAHGTDSFRFVRSPGRAWDLPNPVKCYGFPNEVYAYYQNAGFLAQLQLKFENLLSDSKYLGPLREYPKREYSWSGSEPADMGQRGERVVEALLASKQASRFISLGKGRKKQTLEQRVAVWLKELKLIDSFKVEPISREGSNIYRVKVTKQIMGPEVLITDVGFGVSQILPVVVLCYYVPDGSVIILEQPEIHLHPAVQAGLADVFIDVIKSRKIQVIFESHSEHLLKRLQRRVAEQSLLKDDVALYFCEPGKDASRVIPLSIDPYGTIENWPKDFFGDQFGEIAATTQAVIDRKVKGNK